MERFAGAKLIDWIAIAQFHGIVLALCLGFGVGKRVTGFSCRGAKRLCQFSERGFLDESMT